MTDSITRQPAGIPVGGQFASHDRPDADVDLSTFLFVGDDKTELAVLDSKMSNGVISYSVGPGVLDEFDAREFGGDISDWIDPHVTLHADGTKTFRWAVGDDTGGSFDWEDMGLKFQEFTSEHARDEFVAEQLAEGVAGDRIFIVEHFEHGQSRYSVLGTYDNYMSVTDRWDSRPSCVLVLADDFTDPRQAADGLLEEYTSWCNGDVYGIREVTVAPDGTVGDEESVWGFIGSENAAQSVKEGI